MTDTTWQIDTAHSGIHFSVRHLMIAKVRGQFSRWQGTLSAPDGDLARASVEVTIEADSIFTRNADRDAHLRSADFFDVERYPVIAFAGRPVEAGGDRLTLAGDLTLHGVTRPVSLEVEIVGRTRDLEGNQRAVFTARTSLDRKDFGLTWNQALETGGVLVGDRVDVEIEVEAVRQTAAQPAAEAA